MPTSDVADTLLDVLSRAERRLSSRFSDVLAAQGSNLDEWRVLSLLADRGGQSMSAIAAATLLAPPTLTKRIDVMVADGMVHRRVDDTDRRRVLVLLAPRGRTAHRRLAEHVADETRRTALRAADLGVDVEQIAAALTTLVEALDGAADPAHDPVAAPVGPAVPPDALRGREGARLPRVPDGVDGGVDDVVLTQRSRTSAGSGTAGARSASTARARSSRAAAAAAVGPSSQV